MWRSLFRIHDTCRAGKRMEWHIMALFFTSLMTTIDYLLTILLFTHQFITQLLDAAVHKCRLANTRCDVAGHWEIKVRLRWEILIDVVALVKADCFQVAVRVIWIWRKRRLGVEALGGVRWGVWQQVYEVFGFTLRFKANNRGALVSERHSSKPLTFFLWSAVRGILLSSPPPPPRDIPKNVSR